MAETTNTDDAKRLEEEKSLARKFAEGYALKAGYMLNPDEKVRETVIEGLARNKIRYGYRYCPCRRVEGNYEVDKYKICPCKWHKEEIARDGHCHCTLFFKKDK